MNDRDSAAKSQFDSFIRWSNAGRESQQRGTDVAAQRGQSNL
jgi:hypothetical protein